MGASNERVRLAELCLALSLATDLGTGQPLAHGLGVCWVSLRVADALGLGPDDAATVYYTALLRFLGCTSDASDTAAMVGGDEVAFNAVMAPMLGADATQDARHFVSHVGVGLPWRRRVGLVARGLWIRAPSGAACPATARSRRGWRSASAWARP